MPTSSVDGTELYFERRGAGEPLLLIQGMGGNHLHWGPDFVSRLEGVETIAYDHRGVGRSAPLAGAFTIADLAADAAGLLDSLGLGRVHVLGISMGGMVAQELALRHPDRVRSLTLGCTTPGGAGSVRTDPAVIQALGAALMSGDRERAMQVAWDLNVSAAFAANADAKAAMRELSLQLPTSVPVLMAQAQAIAGHDTLDRLPGITAPTLVIHGTDDRMLSVANGRLIAERIPGSQLEVYDGVGHLFWWEEPERSAALVTGHVGRSG